MRYPQVLFDITNEDLREMGVSLGSRKRILKHLKATKHGATARNSNSKGVPSMIRWSQPVLLNDIVFGEQLEKTLGRMVVSGLARMGVILRVLCGETRRTYLCTMNVPAALTKKKPNTNV